MAAAAKELDLRVARWEVGTGGFMSHVTLSLPSGPVAEVTSADLEVVELYVHPLRRGRGWGALLMRKACDYGDRQGARMGLRAHPKGYGHPGGALTLDALKQFYNGFGFRTVQARLAPRLTYNVPINTLMVRP